MSYVPDPFPSLIHKIADRISLNDTGPFPLSHGDFGHNNMVFDDGCRLLGVIDWEYAFAAPVEIAGLFPLSLAMVPAVMDAPWNYDENGCPVDPGDVQRVVDREGYVEIVKRKEGELGLEREGLLSKGLQDSKRQYLGYALGLFQRGEPGWYARVGEGFLEGEVAQAIQDLDVFHNGENRYPLSIMGTTNET